MSNLRKKALEDFSKDVERGIPLAEDYVGKTGDIYDDALRARNLSEEALAQKVLQDTGIPIPDKTAPISRKEDFLNRILQERYPEIKKPIKLESMDGAAGLFKDGNIILNKDTLSIKSPEKLTSDVLHEGAHAYDKIKKITPEISQDDFNKELRKLKASGFDLKNADPAQVYELIAQKHHAQIPNLREGTFGLGALKSYLKSGTFKALPIIGTGLGAGLALLSGEANAASALPILGEAGDLGPQKGSVDYEIENPQANPEARRKALESLLKK